MHMPPLWLQGCISNGTNMLKEYPWAKCRKALYKTQCIPHLFQPGGHGRGWSFLRSPFAKLLDIFQDRHQLCKQPSGYLKKAFPPVFLISKAAKSDSQSYFSPFCLILLWYTSSPRGHSLENYLFHGTVLTKMILAGTKKRPNKEWPWPSAL